MFVMTDVTSAAGQDFVDAAARQVCVIYTFEFAIPERRIRRPYLASECALFIKPTTSSNRKPKSSYQFAPGLLQSPLKQLCNSARYFRWSDSQTLPRSSEVELQSSSMEG